MWHNCSDCSNIRHRQVSKVNFIRLKKIRLSQRTNHSKSKQPKRPKHKKKLKWHFFPSNRLLTLKKEITPNDLRRAEQSLSGHGTSWSTQWNGYQQSIRILIFVKREKWFVPIFIFNFTSILWQFHKNKFDLKSHWSLQFRQRVLFIKSHFFLKWLHKSKHLFIFKWKCDHLNTNWHSAWTFDCLIQFCTDIVVVLAFVNFFVFPCNRDWHRAHCCA